MTRKLVGNTKTFTMTMTEEEYEMVERLMRHVGGRTLSVGVRYAIRDAIRSLEVREATARRIGQMREESRGRERTDTADYTEGEGRD